ncbi:Zinc-binding oxidoreductase alcohol dehydrogenase [Umbelopsis nana]
MSKALITDSPGNDLYGAVVAIGDGVKDRNLVGKMVAALAALTSDAFGGYAITTDGMYFEIPGNVSGAEASTIPEALHTALHGLFASSHLNLSRDGSSPEVVLVWGGNTSVGRYAIRLARLYGHTVITTASNDQDELKELEASKVYNYRDSDLVEQFHRDYGDVTKIYDAVAIKSSAQQCGKVAGNSAAHYTTVRPPPGFAVPHQQYEEDFSSNIKVSRILTFQGFDDDRPEADLSKQISKELPSLLANGKVLPNKVRLLEGLDKVEEG